MINAKATPVDLQTYRYMDIIIGAYILAGV